MAVAIVENPMLNGSTIRLDELLATYPVALLVPATAGDESA